MKESIKARICGDITLSFYLFTSPTVYKTLECNNNSTASYKLSSLPAVVTGICTTDGADTRGTLTMTFSGVGIRTPVNTQF